MNPTPCECTAAGWCERHHCTKNAAARQFCRTNQIVFDAFEAGRGPCEPSPEMVAAAQALAPGLIEQTLHLGQAVVRHAHNGFTQVSSAMFENRLAVCRACPTCDTAAMVCRDCGCYLQIKARWASESCPLSRWPLPVHEFEEISSERSTFTP